MQMHKQSTLFESSQYISKQESHRPLRSLEYQRLYTDFLSEGIMFAYQQPHNRIVIDWIMFNAVSAIFQPINGGLSQIK